MVWVFPSTDAAAQFLAAVTEGATSSPASSLLEALPPLKAQGVSHLTAAGVTGWEEGVLGASTAAVLAAGCHSGNNAGVPAATLASMPHALVTACGATPWFAAGAAVMCTAGRAVHKLWAAGPKQPQLATADASATLQAHIEGTVLPQLLQLQA